MRSRSASLDDAGDPHGPGALAQLPGEIRKLDGTRVALVTDPAWRGPPADPCVRRRLRVGVSPRWSRAAVSAGPQCVDLSAPLAATWVIGLGGAAP
jgi:hypothetical protein